MTKQTARNAIVVFGLWSLSRMVAFLIRMLLIAIHNRQTFTGDVGLVAMWLWEGFPDDLVALLAAISLVWVIDAKKPFAWLGGLAALYLYGGVMDAWRQLSHGWRIPPRTPDYIGIIIQAMIPMLVCLTVGVWWTKQVDRGKHNLDNTKELQTRGQPQNPMRRIWVVLLALAVVGCAVFAAKVVDAIGDDPWAIVNPRDCMDQGTRIAELRNQARFDEAVELAIQSAAKGQHADFFYQMVATTYLARAMEDKDQSEKWAKLAGEYADKALASNPKDIANVFNVGVNYILVGDDLSTGGCVYYRKALSVLEGLSPRETLIKSSLSTVNTDKVQPA